MAENVTLTNLANLQNETTATTAINSNNAAITTAFTDVLSRSGVQPNQMTATIDMNSNRIINLPAPSTASEPARIADIAILQSGTSIVIPSNTVSLVLKDQLFSGGVNVVSFAATSVSGAYTVDCGNGPLQYINNGGALTINAPAIDGSTILMITNIGGAGAISFNGFTVGANPGDPTDSTVGHIFSASIWRINGVSGYRIAAHQ